MGNSGLRILVAAFVCAMMGGARAAGAEAAPDSGGPVPAPPGDLRGVLVPTTTRDYQWIFHVPVLTIAHTRVAITGPSATTHPIRWEYEVPALRTKRIKLWDAPEFSCKYADLILPNQCGTTWHAVYADLPVLVNQHSHASFDVLRFGWTERYIDLDVVRWKWTERSFRFNLPVLAPPGYVDKLRTSLDGQRAEVIAATDETLAGIDRQIEAVRAGGGDPARLEPSDGSEIDLLAQRQTLLDEREQELERLAAIGAELTALSTQR